MNPLLPNGHGNPTYIANFTGYTGYTTMTDIFCLSGSDTKTVAVLSFWILMSATAANNSLVNFDFIRRTAANTGGTPTTINPVQNDTADPAATASFVSYGAAPSGLGTATAPSGGVLRRVVNPIWTNAVPTFRVGLDGMSSVTLDPSAFTVTDARKPIILRGSTQGLCLNCNSTPAPAGFTLSGAIEWIEF